MTNTKQWLARFALLAILALVFGLAGYQAAPQAATAQRLGPQDCTLFYAVQPDDSLSSIARRFDTSTAELVDLNPALANMDSIFSGLVLCLSADDNVLIPDTGDAATRAGVTVTSVNPDSSVTVQGANFTPDTNFVVQMLPFGEQNPTIVRIGDINIPNDGSFIEIFAIPAALRDKEELRIRFFNVNTSASTVFTNETADQGAVSPANCGRYYTVRSDETLSEIAVRFNTTIDRLLALNFIADSTLIYPGQRLCIAGEGAIIPPTGRNATLSVVEVDRGDDITLRGQYFPATTEFTVMMGEQDAAAQDFINAGSFVTPNDGLFVRTVNIPEALEDVADLEVWLVSVDTDLTVTRRFQNATDQDGQEDDVPVDTPLDLPDPAASAATGLTPGESAAVSQGNAGASTPSSAYNGRLAVNRYDPDRANTDQLIFTQQLLEVQVLDQDGEPVDDVRGLVYAFFDIKENTRNLYDLEKLAIYRYDAQDESWERCDVQSPVNDDGPPLDRLSCIIDEFGVFGLAQNTAPDS